MEDNKFICRGISKETGEFVYGYYYFYKRHFIKSISTLKDVPTFTCSWKPEKNTIEDITYCEEIEITQEPDKCIGKYDINKKMLFQNDTYNSCDIPKWADDGNKIAKRLEVYYGEFEIIGNTHNIKPN